MLKTKDLSQLYAHKAIESRIVELYGSNKLPHAMLMVGPKGIGKSIVALRLAAVLLTKSANFEDIHPDNPVVRHLKAGTCANLLYVTSDSTSSSAISIDQVRTIQKFLTHTTADAGWKIVIIDGSLTFQGSNGLLKMIEEPVGKTLIVMLTHSLSNTLTTIRSRCHIVTFQGLTHQEIRLVLAKHQINDFADQLIPFCDASPAQAMSLYKAQAHEILHDLYTYLPLACKAPVSLYVLVEKYAQKPKASEDAVDSLEIVLNMLIRIAYLKSIGNCEEMCIQKSSEKWSNNWFALTKFKRELEALHLDRSQTLLTFLHTFIVN